MSAADLPFGTIIAKGPRVMVKLKRLAGDDGPWNEALPYTTRTFPDSDADWCLEKDGYTVVRHGLGD